MAELVEDFWDRQYLRKFGFPYLPLPLLPGGPQPGAVVDIQGLNNEVMASVVGWLANDPDPQPNRQGRALSRNLIGHLSDITIRLRSAKKLRDQMNRATKALEVEITKLGR